MSPGIRNFAALAAVLLAGAALSACTSNGGGSDNGGVGSSGSSGGAGSSGGIDGSSSSGGPLNDGSGPTNITQGGTPLPGHFICTAGAKTYGDVTTAVSANGLVGDQLSALVNQLGGNSATTLLNSVINKDNVIDGKLSTFATYQLTVSLFGGPIDSVGESVIMPIGTTVPAGKFAVFGISFPANTVGLSLLQNATVSTSLAGTTQESNVESNPLLLSLLGQTVAGDPALWLGIKATKPYDTATLTLAPTVLSADVGDALHVYEMCVDGTLKQ
jgi:hypothetical protein